MNESIHVLEISVRRRRSDFVAAEVNKSEGAGATKTSAAFFDPPSAPSPSHRPTVPPPTVHRPPFTVMLSTRLFLAVLLLAGVSFTPLLAADSAPAAATAAPSLAFTLKDQLDREHTEADSTGEVTLLTVADRKGSTFIGNWSKAISEGLERTAHPPVRWVHAATLSGVPSFMRGMVRKMFGSDEKRWTLMDWKGQFAKTYALPSDRASILVFAPDRRLVFQTSGQEVEPAVVAAIVAAISAVGQPPLATTAPSSMP